MGKKLRRFMLKNRDKGIPNLMLYICVANAVLYLYTFFTRNTAVSNALTFDLVKIFDGEVWRCATWLLTYGCETFLGDPLGILYVVFYILFNKWLGSILEATWGTFRLNLYYFGGAILSVAAAVIIGLAWMPAVILSSYYLNLSLLLAVATMIPEERILLMGIFPLKMRWLALLDIILIIMGFTSTSLHIGNTIPFWAQLLLFGTAPLVSILNYVLNFGKDVGRLFGNSLSYSQKKKQKEFKKAANPNPAWANNYRSKTGERPYRHKCTVCGRTDTEYPDLGFRYCSRCKGYFCYCTDHIKNHTHIE